MNQFFILNNLYLTCYAGFRASFQLIIIRGLIQAAVSLSIVEYNRRQGEKSSLFGNTAFVRAILALRALFGWAGIGFGFLAIEHLPIADASVLLMQSPVLAAILGFFVLGEPWKFPEFCSTVVSMIGVVLIARPHFIFDHFGQGEPQEEKYDSMGPVFGLLAAAGAGASFITVRMLGTSAKLPWANVGFAAAFAQALISIPVLYFSGQDIQFNLGLFEWSLLILGACVGTTSQLAMTIGIDPYL